MSEVLNTIDTNAEKSKTETSQALTQRYYGKHGWLKTLRIYFEYIANSWFKWGGMCYIIILERRFCSYVHRKFEAKFLGVESSKKA